MKNQALFSSKDKSKKLKCHLLQFLFGALRVNSVLQQWPDRRDTTFCKSFVEVLLIIIGDVLLEITAIAAMLSLVRFGD